MKRILVNATQQEELRVAGGPGQLREGRVQDFFGDAFREGTELGHHRAHHLRVELRQRWPLVLASLLAEAPADCVE